MKARVTQVFDKKLKTNLWGIIIEGNEIKPGFFCEKEKPFRTRNYEQAMKKCDEVNEKLIKRLE